MADIKTHIQKILEDTAKSLQQTFSHLGSLNGQRDAPMPERNTVIHLSSVLLQAGFSVYAEAGLPEPRCRIDLFAADRSHALAFEVKAFGAIQSLEVLNDAQRLQRYKPQAADRIDGVEPLHFWEDTEKWGIIVIQSFQGEEYRDLWMHQTKDDFSAYVGRVQGKKIKKYLQSEENKKNTLALSSFLKENRALLGAALVCDGVWKDANRLDLLWASFLLA